MEDSPAVMHLADSAGSLVAVNKRWCELTGRSAAEAMGAGWKQMIHPEDRAALIEAWKQYVSDANRGLRKDGFSFEYRLMHKDGTSVYLCARCTDERDSDGVLLGFCGASVEIPEHYTSPQSNQFSKSAIDEELLRHLAKATPAGVYRTDASGACVWVSEKWVELTGYSMKEALGDGWQRAIHHDDMMRLTREWEKAIAGTARFVSEYRYLKPNGTVVWIFSRVAEQRDEQGNLTGYVGVVVDISELRQKEGSKKNGANPHTKISALTKRENDVVRLLRAGLPNKQMASCLGLSVRTVEAHRMRIMRKLGFRTLAELLQFAMQRDSGSK